MPTVNTRLIKFSTAPITIGQFRVLNKYMQTQDSNHLIDLMVLRLESPTMQDELLSEPLAEIAKLSQLMFDAMPKGDSGEPPTIPDAFYH